MIKNKKITAFTLLLMHAVSIFYPGVSYALTNGPSAPESSQFQPASVTNLVDPFSGDFSYNIPLLDVDGYPINIAYNSGGSMDDEASWVGFGWNINPGSVSRVMKGIPDDFNGTDKIVKEYNVRPDITGGIGFNLSTEIFGLDFLGANMNTDIFYNNQRGLGVEIGAGVSATLNTAKFSAGEYTGGLSMGANLGITSNSQTGADFNFGANMGISLKDKENASGALGLRFGGSLNSRAGMKSTTLGASFNTSKGESDKDASKRKETADKNGEKFVGAGSSSSSMSLGSSTTTFGMAFNPTITMPMKNESYSLSPQAGPEFWGFQAPTIQITGHYSKQKLATPKKYFPAYGFLHNKKGKTDPNAILDFNREKDVPYMETTPTLPVPYVTQDVFTATSHLGTSQFKAVSNSTGIFFDSYSSNESEAFSLGVEFGIGGGVKGGGDFSASGSSTVTRKWTGNNDFLQHGDFSGGMAPDAEDAYFKLVGEMTPANKNYLNKIAAETPVKVATDDVDGEPKAFSRLASNNSNYAVSSAIARNKREPRGEVFSPLLASQATYYALDRQIKNYDVLEESSAITCGSNGFGHYETMNRVTTNRKAHHISEIKLIKNDGMRLVYGIPVYNNEQVDVTMSVGQQSPDADNFATYSSQESSARNKSGMDHYFSKETVPAYATSFLLSGICSPDYIDVTGNGISDDDFGSAVKFNYSLVNPAYKWRTPNGREGNARYANFNEGNKSQGDDNKASYSYGTKELWYAHSIESKNMIAVFRLGERNDGYGYDEHGGRDETSRLKKLERIDLYTKAELLANPSDPTPIKSVHFKYDYSLFGNLPNNAEGGGKLTLKSVYFTYGKSKSGEENKYEFDYNPSGNFEYQQYDRWGTYKAQSLNGNVIGVNLKNNDFPYSIQYEAEANEAVQKWQLSSITLPSGGKISVQYESDDYAFVQNRRAMQMAKIVGYGSLHNYSNYQKTDKVYIQLPTTATTTEKAKWEYFEGMDQLYFKTMIDLDNNDHNELVSGYAKILDVKVVSDSIAEVTLQKRGIYHPVAAAGWQYMRQSLPKLAYPYEVDETLGPIAFVKALIAAIRNVGELLTPFESKAMRAGFGKEIEAGKGFARIVNKYKKFGGGLRVKAVTIDDKWGDMVGTGNGKSTVSGMQFDYTTKYKAPDGEILTISSGVASYEPAAGGEENPFRQPITYQQKAHLTSNIYTVEEPLGESYFPAASVGYSEVTIRNLDAEGAVVDNGYNVKKFFTAKDFPTIVKRTDLSKNKYNQSSIFGLFNIDQGNSVVLSQGFYVETNDMHGKALSEETFDGSGKMLSGTYFHYKSSGLEEMRLDNNALSLHADGTVRNEEIGKEFEMYHDMREQVTDNIGVNLNLNLDVLYFVLFVIPIPTAIPIMQSSYCGYEASSTIKIVNRYAIADKVTTIENGSTMTSENMLWDALTGQVLLTKTQNGFDDPLYNFTLPAYLVSEYEDGMGAAFRNTGIVFNNVTVTNGVLPSGMTDYIVPGDELGISGSTNMVWAMQTPGGIKLIDKDGSLYNNGTAINLLLLRSGRRNMLGASTYSVVSLKNPIRGGKIDIDAGTEILSTSAGTFSDEWSAGRITSYISCNVFDTASYTLTPTEGGRNATTSTSLSGGGAGGVTVAFSNLCTPFPPGASVTLIISQTCGGNPGGDLQAVELNEVIPSALVKFNMNLDCIDGADGYKIMAIYLNKCPSRINDHINPYRMGLKGNWRGKESFVYYTNRDAKIDPSNSANLPTNLRKGGIFDQFTSFYKIQSGRFVPWYENDSKWVASATVTMVNEKGQEVENKDALGKYSSAQFGFNGLMTTAVANNCKHAELGYDGFEDYYANPCVAGDACRDNGHFSFRNLTQHPNAQVSLSNTEAHTGNYSLAVSHFLDNANLAAITIFLNLVPSDIKYTFNPNNEMLLGRGGLVPDFTPEIGKKYIISGWIKGNVATAADPEDVSKAKIIVEGLHNYFYTPNNDEVKFTAIAVKAGPKVEGWTRVMTTFTFPSPEPLDEYHAHRIKIKLYPGQGDGVTYFDDIRIHPFDANMKSFAYDYKSSRLMAELDENNYASFYEYNDEGQLLRVKKETEKGIVTLKETRSRVRKNN